MSNYFACKGCLRGHATVRMEKQVFLAWHADEEVDLCSSEDERSEKREVERVLWFRQRAKPAKGKHPEEYRVKFKGTLLPAACKMSCQIRTGMVLYA